MAKSESNELVHLRGGVVVSVRAYLAVLSVEAAGHHLSVDGEDLVVEPGIGLEPRLLAALKTYKRDCLALVQYVADDSHMVGEPQRREVAHV